MAAIMVSVGLVRTWLFILYSCLNVLVEIWSCFDQSMLSHDMESLFVKLALWSPADSREWWIPFMKVQ